MTRLYMSRFWLCEAWQRCHLHQQPYVFACVSTKKHMWLNQLHGRSLLRDAKLEEASWCIKAKCGNGTADILACAEDTFLSSFRACAFRHHKGTLCTQSQPRSRVSDQSMQSRVQSKTHLCHLLGMILAVVSFQVTVIKVH